MSEKLKLGWLFPDTLNLHGDRGNILAFKRLADELELDLEVDKISLDADFNPLNYDILYASAGEFRNAESVISKLSESKNELIEFIEQGRPLLVTGNTVGYFCTFIRRQDGSVINGLNLLDVKVFENDKIHGDDTLMEIDYNGLKAKVSGVQIQMADLIPGSATSFGTLLYGYGDNGKSQNEGFVKNNSIFTELVGPLLVLNPWLAEQILRIAAKNAGIGIRVSDLNFDLEKESLEFKIQFIENKKTDLTNCKRLK